MGGCETGSNFENNVSTYAVYLDTATPPASLICDGLPETECEPPPLAADTTYYWQVVAVDIEGAQTPGPVWSFTTEAAPTADDFAAEVVRLVNQERAGAGCDPLAAEPRLQNAAAGHSEDMALNDFLSHTGSDGSFLADRVNAQGYDWTWIGENIGGGQPSPADVMAWWMNSRPHRANILNCNFTETGVGYYYLENDKGTTNYHHYWTLVLARPAS